MNTINYDFLASAKHEYERFGYKPIEVPWRVSTGILEVTRPPYSRGDYVIEGTEKGLIASGEQGFMSLMNKGILPPGKYQTITPCFRNEPYDDTHSKQFMKLELIEVLDNSQKEFDLYIERIIGEVKDTFSMLAPTCANKLHVTTQDALDTLVVGGPFDIELYANGRSIELGSFGVRRAHFGTWLYGTGLAEPRFSKSILAIPT